MRVSSASLAAAVDRATALRAAAAPPSGLGARRRRRHFMASALFEVVQGHCDDHERVLRPPDVSMPSVVAGRRRPQLGIFLAQRLVEPVHDAGPVPNAAAAALVAAQVGLGEAPRRDDERLARLGAQPRVGAVDGHGHRHARGAGDGVAFTSIAVVDARRPEDDRWRWGFGPFSPRAARIAQRVSRGGSAGRRRRPRRRRGGCPSGGAPFCPASQPLKANRER